MPTSRHRLAAVLSVVLSVGGLLVAQEGESTSGWELRLGMPMFVPATSGTATVRGIERDVDSSIADSIEAIPDLIDALDFILLGNAEFRVNRFLFRGGGMTVDLSGEGELIPGHVSLAGDLELDTFFLEGGYRLGDVLATDIDPALPSLRATFDVFAGIQYRGLSGMFDLGTARAGTVASFGDSVEWLDGIIGSRVTLRPATGGPASVTLEGHIGAGDSDFAWDARGTFDYRVGPMMSMSAGWRAFGVDYSEDLDRGLFRYDVITHGPLLELKLHF